MKRVRTLLPFIFLSVQLFAQNNGNEGSSRAIPFDSQMRVGFMFVYVLLGLLFLMLFAFYPRQRLNLFFGLFNVILFLISLNSQSYIGQPYGLRANIDEFLSRLLGMNILLFMLYALGRMKPFYWWFVGFTLSIDYLFYIFFGSKYSFVNQVVHSIFTIFCFWIMITAFKSKNREDWLIGLIAFAVVFINLAGNLLYFTKLDITRYAAFVPFVITISAVCYLALRYARTNTSLERQLVQVKDLSEENVRREQEKQQLLATQNEMLEQQVKQRTAEITAQKETLEHTLKELRLTQAQLIQSEKMASLGELTAGIAHEIQNPLNFVNNFSEVNKELIQELKEERNKEQGTRNEDREKAIIKDIEGNEEKINHHGKRADAIVKGMLMHSRASGGQTELTDINALCDEYLRLAYHGLRAKDKNFNAKFETSFDNAIGRINIVPQEIGRVILNLINNAFYAVSEKAKQIGANYEPTVTVATKRSSLSSGDGQGEVSITVGDNGVGIPQKIVDKIFQPFFTTKPTGQGTGLGLSLSYDILKAHGGEINVETKEGEGSKFIIKLPPTSNG